MSNTRPKRIRLACRECYREDCDGIAFIPRRWKDVVRFQSYRESIRDADPNDPFSCDSAWYTHVGLCPECQSEEV